MFWFFSKSILKSGYKTIQKLVLCSHAFQIIVLIKSVHVCTQEKFFNLVFKFILYSTCVHAFLMARFRISLIAILNIVSYVRQLRKFC